MDAPSGTVTFLFTDIEGSTRLWEEHPDAMKVALAGHDEIVVFVLDELGAMDSTRIGVTSPRIFA